MLCPEEYVYLDHRQSDHADEPIPVGYLRTLEDVYRYQPPAALGVQAHVWSEHLDTARRVEYRPLDGPLPWQTRPGVPGRPR